MACEASQVFFIFYQQNGFMTQAGWFVGQRGLLGDGLSGGAEARQVDLEGGAFASFAVDPDVAFTLFDNAVHRGEAKPGALQSFGGIEGLEDVALGVGVHAHAGVADGEHHVVAGLHRHMQTGVVRVELDVGRLNGQVSALRHGVTGIDRQVHDDLLDLARIGFDGAEIGTWNHDEVNVFADQPGQHFQVFGDHAVKIYHLWGKHLLTAERH